MKILAIHNYYQRPGGEDRIVEAEAQLLQERGHDVHFFTMHNDQVERMSQSSLAKATLWNTAAYREISTVIRVEKPDVAHFHNTFPLISPAAYYAARAEGIPVVQTLHNFRLFCLNGYFFRDGHVCEDCSGKWMPWPGIVHKCYRNSLHASCGVASMLALHRLLRTWTNQVDVFIAYSRFAFNKFTQEGLPEEKMAFKTNFINPIPEQGSGQQDYAIFVGRLSPEKGLNTLLSAWELLGDRIALKIVGDGPLGPAAAEAAAQMPNVDWLGWKATDEVYRLMGDASMLILPSEWYETFGRVGMESLALGTPVIATKIGSVAELVEHGRTGLHFRPGDPDDLARQVGWALANPDDWARMRQHARADFEAKYTPDGNYKALLGIYEAAIRNRAGRYAG
jgi:glycosyltransferase involved in cell wall biosynthesis